MIKMSDLIKKQGDMIRKESGMIREKHKITFTKDEMSRLHKDGELEKDGHTYVYQEEIEEAWDSAQSYSSKEAKIIIDGAIRNYAKELRKVQGKVVKDWMSKAKAGVIDYFDIVRGLQTGDVKKAHPYEAEFLNKVLNKDKIIDRFRSYFGGKKGKSIRRKSGR